MHFKPQIYQINYVNIDLRHQYGIYVTETETFLLAKRPERRGVKRNGCFCRLACPVCLSVYLPIYLSDQDQGLTQSIRSPGCSIPRWTYSILFSASFLSVEHKVAFTTHVKKKHLMEEGGKISARLARPQVSQFIVYVLLRVADLSETDWVFIHPFVRQYGAY